MTAPAPIEAWVNGGTARQWLDDSSWIDVGRGWLREPAEVYQTLAEKALWQQSTVWRYDHHWSEPRLSATARPGPNAPHPAITAAHRALRRDYGVDLMGASLNWYRDGRDAMGAHRDSDLRWCENTVVAILTVGARRPWIVTPRAGGGDPVDLSPGNGDLIVLGGRAQADWLHGVPRVPGLRGGRISLQWRWTSRTGRPEVGGASNAPRQYGGRSLTSSSATNLRYSGAVTRSDPKSRRDHAEGGRESSDEREPMPSSPSRARSLIRAAGALTATAVIVVPALATGSASAAPAGNQVAHRAITTSEAPCAPLVNNLNGHFRGNDGLFVNASLTFTLSNSKNEEVDAYGCPLNHDSPAFIVSPNYFLPSSGSATEGTDAWSVVGLPANATIVHIEVYPRGAASSDRYLTTDTSHYGRSMVKVDLPTSKDIQVLVPRDDNCVTSPSTGVGTATVEATDVSVKRMAHSPTNGYDIASVKLTSSKVLMADAFSAWADRKDILPGAEGLSLGDHPVDGKVLLPNMLGGGSKGQPYTFVVKTSHYSGKAYSTDYRGRQTFGMRSCSTTTAHVMVLPTSLTKQERHQIGDWLLKHVKHQFLVTNNL